MEQKRIGKILSRNDTGETGGHQAGILVPKREEILSFFPPLNRSEKNPRCLLNFEDPEGTEWSFSFIYYNNSFWGGTRNEYRLTGMTEFIKHHGLRAGDSIMLARHNGHYTIDYAKQGAESPSSGGKLILGSSWKIIPI